jgi:hypothetical protein
MEEECKYEAMIIIKKIEEEAREKAGKKASNLRVRHTEICR